MSKLLAAATIALFAAGCGGSSNDKASSSSTSTPASAPAAVAKGTVTVSMSEFAFSPKDVVVKAGKVTISAPNQGSVPHELVLLKTDADPAKLPQKDGEVDESASVGEIADVAAGATKSHTFTLAPGHYAMVCNLPGHYSSGMYGSLTVK